MPCAPLLDEEDPAAVPAVASIAGSSQTSASTAAVPEGPGETKSGKALSSKSAPQWLGGVLWRSLDATRRKIAEALGSAFRKMHAMDFYITKYQGKMMQSMTPLFAATKGR